MLCSGAHQNVSGGQVTVYNVFGAEILLKEKAIAIGKESVGVGNGPFPPPLEQRIEVDVRA